MLPCAPRIAYRRTVAETQLAPRAERTPLLPTLVRCCTASAATPPRLLRPRRPDTGLLARLEVTDPPPAAAAVKLTVLTQARTAAPEILVAEGHRSLRKYPMSYASFLVEHPRARFLVDPAMCSTPHRRVLPELPFPVPLLVAPDKPVHGRSPLRRPRNGDPPLHAARNGDRSRHSAPGTATDHATADHA